NRLFRTAIEAGKRIRHETAIGKGGASVASVAAELARERMDGLDQATVLVIGAGKIAELSVANLAARGAHRILVANRSPEKAAALAQRFGGRAVSMDELPAAVAAADVVVSSTASPEPVLRAADMPPGRRVLIDLAIPFDIEPEAGRLEGVSLFHVDDLEDV